MFQWIQTIAWVSKVVAWVKSFKKPVEVVEQPPVTQVKKPTKPRKPRAKKPRTTTPKQ